MATTTSTTGVAGLTSLTYYPTPRVEWGRAGSGIETASLVSGGTGYTGANGMTTTAGAGYSGAGAVFDMTDTGGVIDGFGIITAGGDGYRVGDLITLDGGNSDCVLRVDSVTAFDGD